MFREDLPSASLMPIPAGPDVRMPTLRDSGPDAPITPLPPAGVVSPGTVAVGLGLPFKVKVVSSEAQLMRVQALRQHAYGRHLPDQASAFGAADPRDRMPGTIIFYAEDKATGQLVGSARIQSNRHAPLQIEGSVELPERLRGRQLAEITRLCVLPGYDHKVRLALLKAVHLYCIALQIGGVVAGSRRSLLRTYLSLGFVDLFGDERMCHLQHAGGLPHRVLWRETLQADARVRELRPQDFDFVFRDFHPDIEVFDGLAAAVTFGLSAPAAYALSH